MNSQITYWQNIIIGNKKIEPRTGEQMANYQIAEYFLFGKTEMATYRNFHKGIT